MFVFIKMQAFIDRVSIVKHCKLNSVCNIVSSLIIGPQTMMQVIKTP